MNETIWPQHQRFAEQTRKTKAKQTARFRFPLPLLMHSAAASCGSQTVPAIVFRQPEVRRTYCNNIETTPTKFNWTLGS